jgi:hypothetical protein
MAGKKKAEQQTKHTEDRGEIEEVSQTSGETLPALAHADVDKALLDEAVTFINEKANETLYRGSEEIGAYLLEKFFDNDIKVASSKKPQSTSYAALCQRQDLAVHPATLSVMVRVAAQESFFKEKGFDPAGLTYTHKAELVKLPNTDEKIGLAQKALASTLTTRLLSEEVKKAREQSGGTGKVVTSVIEKYMTDPVRLFENLRRNDFLSDPENLKKMRAETRKKLHEMALEMRAKTKAWGERYAALAAELENIEQGMGK